MYADWHTAAAVDNVSLTEQHIIRVARSALYILLSNVSVIEVMRLDFKMQRSAFYICPTYPLNIQCS
jgi:hypothetical protein